jgi:hypothetical protein
MLKDSWKKQNAKRCKPNRTKPGGNKKLKARNKCYSGKQ